MEQQKYRIALVVPFVSDQVHEVDRFVSNWEHFPPCGKESLFYSVKIFFYFNRDLQHATEAIRCRIQVEHLTFS